LWLKGSALGVGLVLVASLGIYAQTSSEKPTQYQINGADNLMSSAQYLQTLKHKKVAIVGNHTSLVKSGTESGKYVHLLDTLLSKNVQVVALFSPEHGFRGKADAGAHIGHEKDSTTGIPVYSLYGKAKRPTAEQLKKVDMLVFDIQDVGCRFYTYISTLQYILEAAAEYHIPVMVLDRLNPNISRIDGPVLDSAFHSFVGLQPVPILYGLSIGQYASMITAEGWYKGATQSQLTVVPYLTFYPDLPLPVAPSPNLPTIEAIRWYPSLCWFEGTPISVGRGTSMPFECVGAPYPVLGLDSFLPLPRTGAMKPPYSNKWCYGKILQNVPARAEIDISLLLNMYAAYPHKESFFTPFFDKLAGSALLRSQVIQGTSQSAIYSSWRKDLKRYRKLRKKYYYEPS